MQQPKIGELPVGRATSAEIETENGTRRPETGAVRCPVAAPIESGESKHRLQTTNVLIQNSQRF